jgi:hypothetical protein
LPSSKTRPTTWPSFAPFSFCNAHKALLEEHGEEAIRSGKYPKSKRQPSTAVTEVITPPAPAALTFDPALVRPGLAATAAEGLEVIRAALLDAANVNKKTFVTIGCKHCGRQGRYEVEVADTRSRVAAIQLLLNEGLGRAPQAEDHQPSVPQSILDVRRLSFPELEALVATHFLEFVHEALEDTEGMLERRVRALAPDQRERVRVALNAVA